MGGTSTGRMRRGREGMKRRKRRKRRKVRREKNGEKTGGGKLGTRDGT